MQYRQKQSRIARFQPRAGVPFHAQTEVREQGLFITLVGESTRQRIDIGVGDSIPLVVRSLNSVTFFL